MGSCEKTQRAKSAEFYFATEGIESHTQNGPVWGGNFLRATPCYYLWCLFGVKNRNATFYTNPV